VPQNQPSKASRITRRLEERYLPPGTFLTPIQAAILFEIYNNQYLVLSLFVSRRDSEAYIAAVGAPLLKRGFNIFIGTIKYKL